MRVTFVGICAVGGAKADVSTPESLFCLIRMSEFIFSSG
jgi:hypothetical protein